MLFFNKEYNIRCGGRCCKRFYLPYGPEVFEEDYTRYLLGMDVRFREIGTIFPMLTYLGVSKSKETGDDGHYYTCCYLDRVSGLCLIYGLRPEMCSAYPYGKECTYEGCCSKPWYRRLPIFRAFYKLYKRAEGYCNSKFGTKKPLHVLKDIEVELKAQCSGV